MKDKTNGLKARKTVSVHIRMEPDLHEHLTRAARRETLALGPWLRMIGKQRADDDQYDRNAGREREHS